MLSRSSPARAGVIGAAAIVVLLAAYLVLRSLGGGPATPEEVVLAEARPSAHEASVRTPGEDIRREVERALGSAVEAGARHDGDMEIALMVAGWPAPIVRASGRGGADRRFRAWSVSKVLTSIALLRRMGWSEEPGVRLSPEVSEAMDRALTRSENCPQRRLTIELQRIGDGTPDSARAAIAEVLRAAGATGFEVARQAQPPEPLCAGYMERATGVLDPHATALLAGTTTWTVGDAARVATALDSGVFGRAVGRRLLSLLARPKLRSAEAQPIDFTAPLDWGVGAAIAPRRVAYKAGWGGTQQQAFVAEQIAVVPLGGGVTAGIAIAFHPHTQPLRDDPGVTQAPDAITEAARALITRLDGLGREEGFDG